MTHYKTVIESIEQEKKEIQEKIQYLEQTRSNLMSMGVSYDDILGIQWKWAELVEKLNQLCEDLDSIKKDAQREKNYERKIKKYRAEEDGVNAYWEAIENGSFEPVCQYTAKDLKAAWEKGLKSAIAVNGYIGSTKYAA
ncbi:MAG: hypothetical protein RLZZ435_2573 [Cyanobacteriota bacterium]|jgi:peptidoglycan hydrolase CwlO-like protein